MSSIDGDASTISETGNIFPIRSKLRKKRFFTKVYALVFSQLLIDVAIVGSCIFFRPAREILSNNYWIAYVFLGIYITIIIPLSCSNNLQRKYPLNVVLLLVMTICYGIFAGALAAKFQLAVVLYAFMSSAVVTIVMTFVGFWFPCDVLSRGFVYCTMLLSIVVFTVVSAVVVLQYHPLPTFHLVFSGFIVTFISTYLMVTVQSIMHGSKGEVSEKDYIQAVILLYTAKVAIFTQILQFIFGFINVRWPFFG